MCIETGDTSTDMHFSGGWARNLSKVVEMNPSPLFVEESVKDNPSYRSIVVWRGGKLQNPRQKY